MNGATKQIGKVLLMMRNGRQISHRSELGGDCEVRELCALGLPPEDELKEVLRPKTSD